MGDVPIQPEPEPEERPVRDAIRLTVERAETAVRYTLTSDPKASIRRTILFLVVGAALVLDAPLPGIAALVILALTDQVVPL